MGQIPCNPVKVYAKAADTYDRQRIFGKRRRAMAVNDISSNIINQLGGGSGIDTRNLVNQLVELERAPEEQRLNRREEKLEAQISGLGLMRSAVDEFEGVLGVLSNPDTFNAKSASISDTSLMAVNELKPDAVPGNYRIKIEQVAQSQSLSSAPYASLDSAIGTGTLTLRFGDWADDLSGFTVDPNSEGAAIEIDESNNSLAGLRDAINKADVGVQASIVGQEGSYQLLLTGPTGATKELEITAAEGATAGLANFNFNEANKGFTEQQKGQDAILRVNGLQVTRENNTIDDVIDGVEFDIFNSDINEEISINVSEDRGQAEEAIRGFVEAYNSLYKEMQFLLDNDSGEEGQGSLNSDPLAANMLRTIRGQLGAAVPGIEGGFSSLANMGIRTKLDGTLEIVENGKATDFRAAMDNNFEEIRNLFVPNLESTNARIDATAFGNRTQAGSYEVDITQDASRGVLAADPAAVAGLDTTGKDYSFTVKVDGKEAAPISLPEGKTYASGEELANELQTLINLDSTLKENNAKVRVTYEGGALKFESNAYGKNSQVEFTAVGADMGDMGITVKKGTAGVDVAGTINGEEAFGFGQVLRGAIGSPAEGLSMLVAQGATGGTITFSRGLGANLAGTIDGYMRSNSGLIAEREANLRSDLDEIEDDRDQLDRRTEAFRARQESQFLIMEQIVRSLNNTGDFLDGINDRLPFTAKSS
ncbi:flagellar filament capping protein FliD [Marinimicrobium sp. C2-29]|uniref:flagellar filament capping protein FliD n=1 Tax=Marinimicrobium sp. C2-29 TaxID=3139825 RepID=UPI003139E932